mmetsp:Transcript_9106/g.27400  ORF Transcript_9106/g.27400 Transcript_9106/m.27400 type:complete len:423 (+) Transcript_9106:57-1325(+)
MAAEAPGFAQRVGIENLDWAEMLAATAAVQGESVPAEVMENLDPQGLEEQGAEIEEGIMEKDEVSESTVKSRSEPVTIVEVIAADRSLSLSKRNGHDRLRKMLLEPTVELHELRKHSWKGLPSDIRPMVWKLLLGYLPMSVSRRVEVMDMKRSSYKQAVDQYWKTSNWSHDEELIFRQISVDIPRTCPEHRLFHVKTVQEVLQRILFVWALKHPASGYVQGMNDLVSPFVYVFLLERCPAQRDDILSLTSLDGVLSEDDLFGAEADSYWCLTALLDSIQDYYTFAQPGIQRRVHYLEDFIQRVDPALREHLRSENLEFLQFAFRWLNCLLMRELPLHLMVRVWDTYMSEPDGFAVFHVYVCAALLSHFSSSLRELDFQELVIFLQNLPTQDWTTGDVDMILSQAFMWRTIFDDKKLLKDLKF